MDRVTIIDVSPRDGLQNEDALVSTEDKVTLVHLLARAGLRHIEVASFVHPGRVPQMADAEDVIAGLALPDEVGRIGLVLNTRGADRAIAAGVGEMNMVVAASDGFALANQGMEASELLAVAAEVAEMARQARTPMSVTVSTSFGCPFDGEVAVGRLAEVLDSVAALDPTRINLADTIGVATPRDVAERVAVAQAVSPIPLGAHFHNTRNTGYANAVEAFRAGVTFLDASAGGIGGCPFAPNATGNIATDDLVYMFERMGIETGIDLDRLMEASRFLQKALGKEVPALLPRAGGFP